MTGYLAGLAAVVLLCGGGAMVGSAGQRRLMPNAAGPEQWLARIVLALGAVTVCAELLGAVGWFGRTGLVAVAVILIAVGWGVRARPARRESGGSRVSWIAPACAGFVLAGWTSRIAAGARRGIYDVDSLRYHLPLAARMAQTGWTSRLHFTELDLLSTFDPLNAELLHGVGMAALHRDVLSPWLNVGWLAVALLAGWCAGSPRGRTAGGLGLLTAAVVCALPLSNVTMAGSATNDVAVLALLLAAVALVQHDARLGSAAVAGVAVGLAVGTKFAAVAPAATLSALVISLPGRRLARLGAWMAGAIPVGCFWYLRNLFRVGSPVPSLRIPGLPSPNDRVLRATGFSVAHYALRRRFWAHVVPSGLAHALGPLWPVLVAVCALGLLIPLAWPRKGDEVMSRMLAVAALGCAAAYAVTPYGAGGPDGDPWLFPVDVRFAYPAAALAVLALGRWCSPSRRATAALAAALVAVVVAGQFGRFGPGQPAWGTGYRPAALIVACAVMGGVIVAGRGSGRWAGLVVAVGLVVGAVGLRATDDRWYSSGPGSTALTRWAAKLDHARIGVVGVPLQYPFYGRDLTNRVDYLGRTGPHGSLDPLTSCAEFVAAVRRAGPDFVVVGPDRVAPTGTPEIGWVVAAGGRVVLSDGSLTVLTPGRDAAPCSAT